MACEWGYSINNYSCCCVSIVHECVNVYVLECSGDSIYVQGHKEFTLTLVAVLAFCEQVYMFIHWNVAVLAFLHEYTGIYTHICCHFSIL